MKNKILKFKTIVTLLFAFVICSVSMSIYAGSVVPKKEELSTGKVIYKNEKAVVDASNISLGLVDISYTGGKNVIIKLLITKKGGTTYTYNLNNEGIKETFALTEGDGVYSVKVYENTSGTKYSNAYSKSLDVKISNDFSPFLYANQYVNFKENSLVSKKANLICKGKKTNLEKLTATYNFVINNFEYDYDQVSKVKSGYIPNVDEVLTAKKGICFDYVAVMASMLRSENVPCKIVFGYAGKIYHAWINVYVEEKGWVTKAIYFDGKKWNLMDPTFASIRKGDPNIDKYIKNQKNYTQKFAY